MTDRIESPRLIKTNGWFSMRPWRKFAGLPSVTVDALYIERNALNRGSNMLDGKRIEQAVFLGYLNG